MEIRYLTRNRTYTSPEEITARYIVVHSTAAGLTSRMTLFNAWNSPAVKLSCHGMVDDTGWMLTLPLTYKGWHVGGKGNGESIGFEICEPPFIRYVDAAHTKIDTALYRPQDRMVKKDFDLRWRHAAELAAELCRQSGLGAQQVLSHREMHTIGKATNHADVGHWFDLFGPEYGMDAFRAEVARQLRSVRRPKGSPGILGRRRSLNIQK